jgi:hypothetical protein
MFNYKGMLLSSAIKKATSYGWQFYHRDGGKYYAKRDGIAWGVLLIIVDKYGMVTLSDEIQKWKAPL